MPIEINLRLGGAETWSMVKSSYDVDLLNEHLNLSLGMVLNQKLLDYKSENPRFRCTSKDIHPAKNCFINNIDIDLDRLQFNRNLSEICVFRSPGDKLDREDYVGWFTVKSDLNNCKDGLSYHLNQILDHVKIEFIDL
jgi:hypothetical protein